MTAKGKSNNSPRPKSPMMPGKRESAGKRTDEISRRLCPHLALENDPDTSLLFPSASGFCYRASPPASPRLVHQQNYCLSARHKICPIMRSEAQKPLPEHIREPDRHRDDNDRIFPKISGKLLLLVVFGLALVLSASWYFSPLLGWASPSLNSLVTSTAASPSTATMMPVPAEQDIERDSIIVPSPTVAAFATRQTTPTSTPSKPATPTPIPTQPQ